MAKRGRKNGESKRRAADMTVGRKLRLFRQVKNISQKKLGEMVGLTFQQIQKYETGYNRISAGILWEFSIILGMPIQDFFDAPDAGFADDEPPPMNFKSLRAYLASHPDGFRKVLSCVATMMK